MDGWMFRKKICIESRAESKTLPATYAGLITGLAKLLVPKQIVFETPGAY